MKINEGKGDRVQRVVVAFAIGVILYAEPLNAVLGTILFIAMAVLLVTGLIGFCPLYRVLGTNTCKKG